MDYNALQAHSYLVWSQRTVDCFIFHTDIDECAQGSAGYDQNCTNTNGSYVLLYLYGWICTGIR